MNESVQLTEILNLVSRPGVCFVDTDPDTFLMDPSKIESRINDRSVAILPVHIYGLPADMDSINKAEKAHSLKVIEDACQAHGARFQGKKVGTIGDCAAFSFNQNKCLCAGEGGMFVTNNKDIYDKAVMLWSFGETRTPTQSRDYHVYHLGWMYRNNDLTAAFGRAQLTKLDKYNAALVANQFFTLTASYVTNVAVYYHPDALAIGLILMMLGIMYATILLVYFAHVKTEPADGPSEMLIKKL